MEVELQFFVTAALDRSDCLAARPPRFISEPKKLWYLSAVMLGWSTIAVMRNKSLLLSVIEPRISDHEARNLVTHIIDTATRFTRQQ
jgi:hypothetical protein